MKGKIGFMVLLIIAVAGIYLFGSLPPGNIVSTPDNFAGYSPVIDAGVGSGNCGHALNNNLFLIVPKHYKQCHHL